MGGSQSESGKVDPFMPQKAEVGREKKFSAVKALRVVERWVPGLSP